MAIEVTGNHPYADAFPMASEEELDELASSIASVGLIHPIVLTPRGEVLDGRNRLAACRQVGMEPDFETREGSDDDYKEFVIGANTTGRRESMTVQIAAASTALILGHEKRKNGRWMRNSIIQNSGLQGSAERESLRCAGLVMDELGPAHLIEVRDGEASLNAKYKQACQQKEARETAEARKIEATRKAEEREQRAQDFFDNDSAAREWLDAKPEGAFANMRAAFSAIQEEREEIRQAEEERRRQEEQARREKAERISRHVRYLETFVESFQWGLDMATWPERKAILDKAPDNISQKFLEIENTYLKGHGQ